MKELNKFVADVNTWNNMFGKYRPLDLANAKDRQTVADELDMRLSPENLSCDGELPASQVRAKYNFLTKAAGQLLKLDPSVKIYEFA